LNGEARLLREPGLAVSSSYAFVCTSAANKQMPVLVDPGPTPAPMQRHWSAAHRKLVDATSDNITKTMQAMTDLIAPPS
jgi:hypothetical protein